MRTSDFYYDLPKELIAQDPLSDRSSSRLLVLDRHSGKIGHHHFYEILSFLNEGDVLVINDTKVIPARLIGEKTGTGGRAELLLLHRQKDQTWECLAKPGKRLRKDTEISFGDGLLRAVIEEELPDGRRLVRFCFEGIFEEVLDRLGEMPLPPYITHTLEDRTRYNTVYAVADGSAAAPTAGLHFTKYLLRKAEEKGIRIAPLTLHVGLGTFRPVSAKQIEDHKMHSESFILPKESAETINRAKDEGKRIVCVGTTSCRTVETAAGISGGLPLRKCSGDTDIFLYPGCKFRVMDGLITNFHLPESTLLMLVSAFAGREKILAAYEEAVKERYRFFSFGDAMLIL